MGVNYHDAPDIVNRINGSGVINQRVGDFKSGVEFFGSISLHLARAWVVKGEYEYLLSSYSLPSSFGYGTAEFSYVVHMPTVIVQYILYEAPTYNLKAGAGIGYHFGTYTEKYSNVDASFSGKGIGSLLELEGNTALGDHLCAYLGIQSRWDLIGELKDELGKPPSNSTRTTFHFFSVSARLGMSYYF